MAYVSLDDLRGPDGALDQFTAADGIAQTHKDILLQDCLDDAEAIINAELGFVLTAATEGDQVVYGDGTAYLSLPLYVPLSVDEVAAPTGYTVPDYIERDGMLVTTDAVGILVSPYSYYQYGTYPPLYSPFATSGGIWAAGVPYTVTADWGASAADLLVARRITLELAVQFFRFKDAGGSQVLGVEGAGAVVVKNAFSPVVQAAITNLQRHHGQAVGVW